VSSTGASFSQKAVISEWKSCGKSNHSLAASEQKLVVSTHELLQMSSFPSVSNGKQIQKSLERKGIQKFTIRSSCKEIRKTANHVIQVVVKLPLTVDLIYYTYLYHL